MPCGNNGRTRLPQSALRLGRSAARQEPGNDEEHDAAEGDGVARPHHRAPEFCRMAGAFVPDDCPGRGDDGPEDCQRDDQGSIRQGVE
jgi:hypothetical protein